MTVASKDVMRLMIARTTKMAQNLSPFRISGGLSFVVASWALTEASDSRFEADAFGCVIVPDVGRVEAKAGASGYLPWKNSIVGRCGRFLLGGRVLVCHFVRGIV